MSLYKVFFFRLNSTKGWLADAVGNYSVDSKCTWLIEGPETSSHIRLHLKEFATECGWDHLYIYDGDSVGTVLSAHCPGNGLDNSLYMLNVMYE